MTTNDIPDREVETVAFRYDTAYSIEEQATSRRWWQFWKPKTRKILVVEELFWHTMVELGPTSVEVIVVVYTVEDYCKYKRLLDTLPREFEYPPVALVPVECLDAWCRRHRVMFIHDWSLLPHIQEFITRNSVPEAY